MTENFTENLTENPSSVSAEPTVFDNIINGVWPGRFVWQDSTCVAFATIEPVAPGHVLVVPRTSWPVWTGMPADDAAHLFRVAHLIGGVQETVFGVARAGLVIAGFEVPHTHLHVIPLRSEADASLAGAMRASDAELDEAMTRLREGLVAAGHGDHVPASMTALD